jgi:dihydrofolate reductase
MTRLNLIVAMDENNCIGTDKGLPWHIPDELKHFKETTNGFAVIMGRNTWESLPKQPLPNRLNIVLSNTLESLSGACVVTSLAEAIELGVGYKEIFIIGGEKVYRQAMGSVDRLIVSRIKGKYEGTVYFPVIGKEWHGRVIKEFPDFKVYEYEKVV